MKKLTVRLSKYMEQDIKDLFDKDKVMSMPEKVLYVKDAEQLSRILTTKRIELLFQLDKPKNIKEITKQTKRKQEAISRDVSSLENNRLVKKIKKGREIFVKKNVDKIEIDLSN